MAARELMFLRLSQADQDGVQSQQGLNRALSAWAPRLAGGVLDHAGSRLPHGPALADDLRAVRAAAGSFAGPEVTLALCARDLPWQSAAVVAELTARGHLGRETPGGKGGDTLEAWAERTGRRRTAGHGRGGLRFAFYGRVSTEDWQDPVTSRAGNRPPPRSRRLPRPRT